MLSRSSFYPSLCVACFLMLAISVTPFAQKEKKKKDKVSTDDVIRVETELVQLDVIVTDKKGTHITDLKREDFVLKEDGQAQSLTSFEFRALQTTQRNVPPSQTPKPEKEGDVSANVFPAPSGRYIVLTLDDSHIRFENVVRTRQALLKFVNEQMQDDDYVALFSTSGQLALYQQFTNDRAVLRHAIQRIQLINRPALDQTIVLMGYKDLKRVRITPFIAELVTNEQIEVLSMLGGDDYGSPEVRAASEQISAQNRIVTQASLATIKETIRALRTLPGRKMMVLLSEGFLLGGGITGTVTSDLSYLIDAATRSGVTIYSFDVRGLKAYVPGGDASVASPDAVPIRLEMNADQAEQTGARTLAEQTGGLAITDNNDINFGFQKFLADTESYYLLAFEPQAAMKDGHYHKLQITLPNYPEYKVRTRKGYVAYKDPKNANNTTATAVPKTPEQIAEETNKANAKLLLDGLASLYPLRGIPVEMDVNFLDIQNQEAFVSINMVIDATKLKYDRIGDRYRTQLELACNIYDEKGKLAHNFSEYLTLNPKAETLLQATKSGGFRYRHNLRLKPGVYQIRLAVREDKETRVGSATDWIEIPDLSKQKLFCSEIVFLSPDEIKNLRGTAPLKSEGQLDQIDAWQKAQVAHLFKRESPVQAVVAIYNAKSTEQGAADLQVEGRIFSRGKEIAILPQANINKLVHTNSTGEAVLYQVKLPLQTLVRGEYELRLDVGDVLAKTKTTQSITFKVE